MNYHKHMFTCQAKKGLKTHLSQAHFQAVFNTFIFLYLSYITPFAERTELLVQHHLPARLLAPIDPIQYAHHLQGFLGRHR